MAELAALGSGQRCSWEGGEAGVEKAQASAPPSPAPEPTHTPFLTSSLMCSTCSSSSSFLSVSVLFFFNNDWPMRAANSRSRSF